MYCDRDTSREGRLTARSLPREYLRVVCYVPYYFALYAITTYKLCYFPYQEIVII